MIKKQAHLFFPHSEEEDLDELWEQRFFKHKEYFLTRTPVARLWTSRLNRINKERNAYLVLSDKEIPVENFDFEPNESINFSSNFIVAFNAFHLKRNQNKSKVLQANSFMQLSEAINNWLKTEGSFAQYWAYAESEQNEIKVAMAKEADPMEFLKGLKEAEI